MTADQGLGDLNFCVEQLCKLSESLDNVLGRKVDSRREIARAF
jgi:hypothetical protein